MKPAEPAATTQPIPVEHPAGREYDPEKDDPTFSVEEFPALPLGEKPLGIPDFGERIPFFYDTTARDEQDMSFDEAAEDLKRQIRDAGIGARAPRDHRIDPRRAGPFIFALVVASLIFVTSALFSFATVATAASEWMLPPWAWLAWVVPGFVEAFIVYFGVDTVINQANGRKKDAVSALVWMFVFAGVGVVANGAHTASAWLELGDIPWMGFIGIAMSALAPLSVVLITKRVSRLVFLDPNA